MFDLWSSSFASRQKEQALFALDLSSVHFVQHDIIESVILSGATRNEESGWGRHDHHTVTPRSRRRRGSLFTRRRHSEEQRSCDVGVSQAGMQLPNKSLPTKREILTSRPIAAPQNDRTAALSSPTGFFTPLHSVQNDRTMEIVSKAPLPHFSSKCRRCDSPTEQDDGLYLVYCPLASDEERKQVRCFHGKDFSSKAVLYNAQRKVPGQVVLSVLPVRAVE